MVNKDSSKLSSWDSISIILSIISGFVILFSFIAPSLFVRYSVSKYFDFSNTGQIGDTFGGIANPFIALAGVILTFLAFYMQVQANKMQREDFRKQLLADRVLVNEQMELSKKQFQEQFDRREIELKNQENDKLMYLSTIVNSCTNSSIIIQSNIEIVIDKINSDNLKFHLISFVSLNDLERICNKLDLEKYLLAYTNFYSSERHLSIKEFEVIISSFDYLADLFIQLKERMRLSLQFDYERKLKLKKIYEESEGLIQKLQIVLFRTAKNSYQELDNILKAYYLNKEQQSIPENYQFHNDYYFKPVFELINNKIDPNKPYNQDLVSILSYSNSAMLLLDEIKIHNDSIKNDLTTDSKNIASVIEHLKTNSQKLISDFLPK